jgi:hypothetical protein
MRTEQRGDDEAVGYGEYVRDDKTIKKGGKW